MSEDRVNGSNLVKTKVIFFGEILKYKDVMRHVTSLRIGMVRSYRKDVGW